MFESALRTLAHAVGTPLNVISGHAELLAEDVKDPEADLSLRRIMEQCDNVKASLTRPLDGWAVAPPRGPRAPLSSLLEERARWTAPHHFDRVRVADTDVSARVDEADGALVLWALTSLSVGCGTKVAVVSANAHASRVNFRVSLDAPLPLDGERELARPWANEAMPRETWAPAMLLYAIASVHGTAPELSDEHLSLMLPADAEQQ